MKSYTKNIFRITLLSLLAMPVMAQETRSAYFTDGYLYRYSQNPAIGNERNFISFPALGSINMGIRSNLGVDDILYNVNGKTTTFMNPNVSVSEAMGNINDKNKLGFDMKLNVLSVGFKAFGGYNTLSFNVRSNLGVVIPGSIFHLAKEGPANTTYDIKDFNAHADAYGEIALGHSRKINENLRVGAAVKFLLGGANIDAEFNKAQLTLGTDQWTAVTDAKIQSSVKGLTYETEEKMRGPKGEKVRHTYVSGADVDGAGLNGFGLAFDLGAEYKLDDEWTFSAALLDLGFINWSNNMVASTNGEKTFTTDRYIFNVDDDAQNSFNDEFDRMGEGLSSLYELQDNGDEGSRTRALGATLNLGAQYTLPAYDKLKFGLLNTTRMQGKFSWTEFRLSANVSPLSGFSAGANIAAGTYGMSLGWILSVHPKGFNMFIATDHTIGKMAKQGVPLSCNAAFNFGINFPF